VGGFIAFFMKSVLEVIQSGTAFLEKKGVEEARLNMEHLLAHVLGLKRLALYLQFDRPLGETELAPLRGFLQRRGTGEPLQHLLGTVEFLDHTFLSDARALIPRPETEELVDFLIRRWKGRAAPKRVIDLGTGSGVIGLSLAAAWPETHVDLVDVSASALALAQENAARLSLDLARVHFHESDLFTAVAAEKPPVRYELVVANLPYIAADEVPKLSREVQHDPVLALDGGVIGDELMQRAITAAADFLLPGGEIHLEHGPEQGSALREGLIAHGYEDAETRTDHSRRERFTSGRRPYGSK
jgi:release factor glutamine methyltransferase